MRFESLEAERGLIAYAIEVKDAPQERRNPKVVAKINSLFECLNQILKKV
jgi:hypothetical protein